jgi:hypothetical protein
MMAERQQRWHHYAWHQVRNNWLRYNSETQNELRNLGWEPPRPAREFNSNPNGTPIYDNFSGEDFLYMHRHMIAMVNRKLEEINDPLYQKVEGWKKVPRPIDEDYPVPPPWTTDDLGFNSFIRDVKSDQYFEANFVRWERDYTDPTYLSQITLGEYGARLEFSIHNMMHMRWAKEPQGERPPADPTNPSSIDIQWDDPSYDYLGDTYSSHVNPIFWKLHGWIDERIEDWKNAHGITGPIEWIGTWMGNMHHQHMVELLAIPDKTLEKADQQLMDESIANRTEVIKLIQNSRESNTLLTVDPNL